MLLERYQELGINWISDKDAVKGCPPMVEPYTEHAGGVGIAHHHDKAGDSAHLEYIDASYFDFVTSTYGPVLSFQEAMFKLGGTACFEECGDLLLLI